jgi:hypothetical protein
MAIGRPRLDADIRRWQCGGLSPAAIAGDAFAGSRRCALVDPKVAWRHRRGPPPHDQPADPESFATSCILRCRPSQSSWRRAPPGRTGSLRRTVAQPSAKLVIDASGAVPASTTSEGLVRFRGVELVSPSLLWIEGVSAVHATVARRKVVRFPPTYWRCSPHHPFPPQPDGPRAD